MHMLTFIRCSSGKSEAIHETGLSGNVVASFFPLIIYIYIYMYVCIYMYTSLKNFRIFLIYGSDFEYHYGNERRSLCCPVRCSTGVRFQGAG